MPGLGSEDAVLERISRFFPEKAAEKTAEEACGDGCALLTGRVEGCALLAKGGGCPLTRSGVPLSRSGVPLSRSGVPLSRGGVLLGRGDDCAVLAPRAPLCVSTDLFMEDVHFRRRYFRPEDIGWKALAVNLSDLAAMGARPVGFTVALSLPPDADVDLVDGLCAGMAELVEWSRHEIGGKEGVPLLGGDLSRAERLHLCLTVFGEAERPLRRGVARPGDRIFLVGETGLARTGLALLERGDTGEDFPAALTAHLRPRPRLREGLLLAELAARCGVGEAGQKDEEARLGLMDLSDGLARDLPRLLARHPARYSGPSGGAPPGTPKSWGARLRLPEPHAEIRRFCASPEEALRQVWLGGEDYALIGTCSPDLLEPLRTALPEARILGQVNDEAGLFCAGLDADAAGSAFDHFASCGKETA